MSCIEAQVRTMVLYVLYSYVQYVLTRKNKALYVLYSVLGRPLIYATDPHISVLAVGRPYGPTR